jgi:acyl-CoA synthetase (AMP-forming)/AMP-acid ligase II/thioesterase domain-containing protein
VSESIAAVLRSRAEETADAIAVLSPDRPPLTYAGLFRLVESIGAQLGEHGISAGDRVALVVPNGAEAATAFLGIAANVACAPLNPGYRHAEFDFAFSDIGVQAIVVAADLESPARELARRRDLPVLELVPTQGAEAGVFELGKAGRASGASLGSDDVALLLHTSGTTSRPKLVPLTHRNLCVSARSVAETLELTPDDRCLNVMPLFHIHGLVGALLTSLVAGGSIVCAPRFHAPSVLGWLSDLAATWYTAVPTIHQSVLARAEESSSVLEGSALRLVRSSSAPLPPPVHAALEEVFRVPVIEAYGMTEASHQMASNPLPPGERKPGSVGLPAGAEVAILDADGSLLSPGEIGEVAVRGEAVFAGYEGNPAANEEAFVGGWFRTGDEGSLDEDGYLFLRGRIKEIVNRGGEKVSPFEVDAVLLSHPAVAQAVTFAVPDSRLGEKVGAAVVLRDGGEASERELQEFAAGSLADFKVPAVIALVDEIPRGATGKLQRIGLADRLGVTGTETPAPVLHTAPRTPLEEELADIWTAVLRVPSVGVEEDFFALGGDSILGAEMLVQVGQRYARDLPLSTLLWAPTVAAFAEALEGGVWDQDSLLVPIQSGGSSPPLFVTHALGNEVFNVSMLKGPLGEGQPLYAVRARLDRFDYASVEDLAAEYVEEVRFVQPSGPYCFASVCSGMAIVIEMARRVQELGERVGLAAVIDPLPARRPRAAYYACRVAVHARNRRLIRAAARRFRRGLAQTVPGRASPSEADDFVRRAQRIRDNYRLRHLPATLSVFSTMDYETPRTYWAKFADRVDWYELAAPHTTIFHQPHVELVGEFLSTALRESQAG